MAVAIKKGYQGGNNSPGNVPGASSKSSTSSSASGSYQATQEKASTAPKVSVSSSVIGTRYTPERDEFEREAFSPSPATNAYYKTLKTVEGQTPDPFQSRYEGAIQNILDGILNRKSFDINNDTNYQALYDLYKERYTQNASRAMRDTAANAAGLTGGYGSTYGQMAAQQAYDNTMQGLNDQNLALMQMAYQMYGDETADRYNQLGAVTGLDNTDYGRYRDTYNDWLTDRAYYANQYQNFYNNDRSAYEYDTGMDWNKYQYDTNMDWSQYQYGDQMDYQRERDALGDYDSAFNRALSLAQNGLAIPARYSSQLEPETLSMLQQLAAQTLAAKNSAGGGPGSGRSGGNDSGQTTAGQNIMTAKDKLSSTTGEKRVEKVTTATVANLIRRGADSDDIREAIELAKTYYNSGQAVEDEDTIAKALAMLKTYENSLYRSPQARLQSLRLD